MECLPGEMEGEETKSRDQLSLMETPYSTTQETP